MKRLLTTTALLLSLVSPAVSQEAYDERQDHATNHGHYTAALEKVCPGMTVTNAKLRAQLDKKYRENPRWKKYFQKQYDLIAGAYDPTTGMDKRYPYGVWLTCLSARTGAKEWLIQDPAAVEQLDINKKNYEAAKRERLTGGSAMAVESPKDTAKAVQAEAKTERAATGRVTEVDPREPPIKQPKVTKTSDPKKIAAFNQGFQSRVANGYCGGIGKLKFNLKVDDDVRKELDYLYVSNSPTPKKQPKLVHLQKYWIEGMEMADYECELADRQALNTGAGLLALFHKASDLPQPKPWLDASEVVKCSEMPNYFACKWFK